VWHLPIDPDTRTTRQLVDVVYPDFRLHPADVLTRPRGWQR
jgi:hypothetical protein